jgi:hypothetical protein
MNKIEAIDLEPIPQNISDKKVSDENSNGSKETQRGWSNPIEFLMTCIGIKLNTRIVFFFLYILIFNKKMDLRFCCWSWKCLAVKSSINLE